MSDDFPFFASEEELAEEARAAQETKEMRERAAKTLEYRFAGRGLNFTAPFENDMPTVAYGTIDDMLFYFRFRNDHGSLVVGDGVKNEALERYIYQMKKTLEKAERELETGIPENFRRSIKMGDTDFTRVTPKHVRLRADVYEYTGASRASYLDGEELVDVFTSLVEGLRASE